MEAPVAKASDLHQLPPHQALPDLTQGPSPPNSGTAQLCEGSSCVHSGLLPKRRAKISSRGSPSQPLQAGSLESQVSQFALSEGK